MNDSFKQVSSAFQTVSEFAESVQVTKATVFRWIRAGELPCVRLGRRVLIPLDALKRILDRQEVTHAS